MRIKLLTFCLLSALSLSSGYGQNKINYKPGLIGGVSTTQITTPALKTTSGALPTPGASIVRIDDTVAPPLKPLMLIDSIEVADSKQLNSDDIQSITVPHMPQADLIRTYGSKAKDGVILITTKKMKK